MQTGSLLYFNFACKSKITCKAPTIETCQRCKQEFRGRRWPHWSRIFDLNDRKVPFVFLSMQYLNYWNIVQRSKWNVSTFQGMSKPCVMFWMHAYTWTTITFKVTNMNLNWQLGKFDLNFFISKLVTYCLKFPSISLSNVRK